MRSCIKLLLKLMGMAMLVLRYIAFIYVFIYLLHLFEKFAVVPDLIMTVIILGNHFVALSFCMLFINDNV